MKNTRIELTLIHITSEEGRKAHYDDTGYKPKLNSVMLKACSNVDAGCQNTEVRAGERSPFGVVGDEIKAEFSSVIPEFFGANEAPNPQDDMPTTLEMLESALETSQAMNKKLERKIKKLEKCAPKPVLKIGSKPVKVTTSKKPKAKRAAKKNK